MRKNLTKKQIISLQTDIDNLFKAGKRYSLSCFKLFVTENHLDFSRLIVIPVKHYGNSVQRNLIRRQVKEIWRTNQDKIKNGIDCAIIVYPDEKSTFSQKENKLLMLLEKSGSLMN